MSGLGIALQLVPLNSVGRPPSPSSLLTVLCCGKSGISWLPVWRLLLLADSGGEKTNSSKHMDPERSQLHQDLHFTLGETKEGRGDGTGRKWLPKCNI